MFKGEGFGVRGVYPVVSRLHGLLNSMIRQFGPCVVVASSVNCQEIVVFNRQIIKHITAKHPTQVEIALDYDFLS